MPAPKSITPCLWFDTEAEEAARFYTGIFPNSRIVQISRYGEVGYEFHHKPAGSVLMVQFELDGQPFSALNGGPNFHFSEAISFQIYCDTQEELDRYWDRLSEGGDPNSQMCGWLKDQFGVSWQLVPAIMSEVLSDHTSAGYARAMTAMFHMKKLDIATLKKAYEGKD